MLSSEELQRYDRQIKVRGFGIAGQEKLSKARVIVAGAGGLGCTSALYLAAAGIGTIRVVDQDTVELSNLNRQVLHWQKDLGRAKAESVAEKLHQLNIDINIEPVQATIAEDNVSQLVDGFDAIVDALDDLPTRFLLNKTAVDKRIPFFHGAIYGFEGRAMTIVPGQTACLKCVYRGLIPPEKPPVVGVTPAIIACIQAAEVIKYIVGIGRLLTNRLLVYDGLSMRFTELTVKPDPKCEHCGHLPARV